VADFACGLTSVFETGLVGAFAADFATGLTTGFTALLAEDLLVEAEMTGVSLAFVDLVDEVFSEAERKRLDSKPPRFLPVSESFFATFTSRCPHRIGVYRFGHY
jgi:hypothetical protein